LAQLIKFTLRRGPLSKQKCLQRPPEFIVR